MVLFWTTVNILDLIFWSLSVRESNTWTFIKYFVTIFNMVIGSYFIVNNIITGIYIIGFLSALVFAIRIAHLKSNNDLSRANSIDLAWSIYSHLLRSMVVAFLM
jgi:hypothetical protein